MKGEGPRIGVLACSCWSRSEGGIDADRIVVDALGMAGVVHAEATDDLCGAGHPRLAGDLVRRHHLDRLVVAGCVCCPMDQRCPACNDERASLREAVKAATGLPWSHHAFVNVRDHSRSTEDTVTMVAMAVDRLAMASDDVPPRAVTTPAKAALVVGAGALGRSIAVELGERGIPTHLVDQAAPAGTGSSAPPNITLHVPAVVASVRGGAGRFRVRLSELVGVGELLVGTVVIAPGLSEERAGAGVGWGLPHGSMAEPPMKVQGMFLAGEEGMRTAGAAAAFLGRTLRGAEAVAVVDGQACIGCSKCVRVCPYGAIALDASTSVALVDPLLCAGCGACASACLNWAAEQSGYRTRELEAAIRAAAARTPNLLVVCNWSAYRALDQAYAEGLLPKGLAILRLPCLARMAPHLVQVAMEAGADPLVLAGCSQQGCHYRDRRALLEDHMAHMEASLSESGDLERVFVLTLGPTDRDVLATRVGEALEERRYTLDETRPATVPEGSREGGWG